MIPIGDFREVAGTPFGFRESTLIGARIATDNGQLGIAGGCDHNFVLARQDADTLRLAARVYDPETGRLMTVRLAEPGLQFYPGNFLDGTFTGKSGASYGEDVGFALETQHFPDSPNQSNFPFTLLRPGETYSSRMVHAFSTRELAGP